LAIRTAENISKAEPFFIQKKKIHDSLDRSLGDRNLMNEEKLNKIAHVTRQLEILR